MKRTLWVLCLILLAGVLVVTSCDTFFSSSWGTERDYDPKNIDINENNADEWLSAAKGNPKLAAAVTKKILADNNPALKSAGVKLAVESAGIGTLIIGELDKVTKMIDNPNNAEQLIKDILGDIQNNFKPGSPGNAAADTIVALVGGTITSNEFSAAYAANAGASEVAEAMMVLVLAISSENSWTNFDKMQSQLDKFSVDNNGKATAEAAADPKIKVLAAYTNLITQDKTGKFNDNEVTKAIKDAVIATK